VSTHTHSVARKEPKVTGAQMAKSPRQSNQKPEATQMCLPMNSRANAGLARVIKKTVKTGRFFVRQMQRRALSSVLNVAE